MKDLLWPTGLGATLLLAAVARAENIPATRLSLKGLEGVALEVAEIQPDAARDGLSNTAIRSAVESRLRKAKIGLLTRDQKLRTPRRPSLCVNVATTRLDTGEYLYTVCLELTQWVALLTDPQATVGAATPVPAKTWSPAGCFGIVPADELREDVDRVVGEMVDEFIDAFHMANPTESAFRAGKGKTSLR